MSSNARQPTVLVVEDDPGLRLLITTVLLPRYHVFGVGDGDEAIDLLSTGLPVDLVITDLGLPTVDGFEVVAWLRRNKPTLPCLVYSGSIGEYSDARMEGLQGYRTLLKPAPNPVLLSVVESVLASATSP